MKVFKIYAYKKNHIIFHIFYGSPLKINTDDLPFNLTLHEEFQAIQLQKVRVHCLE